MNHQPFEEWLLNDKHLNSTEKRELDVHLRTCKYCTSLAETGLALRSARAVAPAQGFALRFQHRLAAQRIVDRRRKLWGLIVLILIGIGLLSWSVVPYLYTAITNPIAWLSTTIGYLSFIFVSLQAFVEAFSIFAKVVPNFIPPYVWMVLISAIAGVGLLWGISIWRFARVPRGVSV